LIAISEIESGEFKIQWRNQNLKNLISILVDLYYGQAKTKELYFNVKLEDSLDKVMLVPENVIWKIIENLLSNAIKFTDKGYIYFSSRLEDKILYINIKDSGNGIDIHTYSDLINPFNIGEYYLNKTHDGIGLGLSIVNKLVKLLNGKIDFNSKILEGSEFSIMLNLDYEQYKDKSYSIVKE
jgi:signal transduction histidine kinase